MKFKNNIVSLEYFKANMETFENLKDKNLFKAILTLVKFQVGNYLLNDTNTVKIDSISPHTVFAFNTALIKDIAMSYDDLEQSVAKVYDSEYKDLLEDKLVIADKEVFIEKDSLGNVNLYDKEQYEYLNENFKDLITKEHGFFINSPYSTAEVFLENRGLKINFAEGNGKGGHELGYKNKIFTDNSLLEYQLEDKKTKEIKGRFIAKDLFKIMSNKIVYCNTSSSARLDMSPRLNFINTAYLELTGLDKYKFNIITNKLQKFIYGYLTNETNYVKSETKGRVKRTYNKEYDSNRIKGKELFENFKEDLEIFINKLEYGIKLNKSKEEILNEVYNSLSSNSQKTIFNKLAYSIYQTIDVESSVEDISSYMVSEMKNFYENINDYFYRIEKNMSLKRLIKVSIYDLKEISDDEFMEKIQDMVSIALAHGIEIDTIEELIKTHNVIDTTEKNPQKAVEFSKDLLLKLEEKLDADIEQEFKYQNMLYTETYSRDNDFGKIGEFLSGYSYIDYSVSAYTKIRQNENIIKDEHDIDDINRILKNFISRARAGIYDLKVDSYILNLRENSEMPMLNEPLLKLYESDSIVKEIVDNLKDNKYYDMFEFDKDFFNGTNSNESKEVNRQKLLDFSKGINYLELPVGIKNTFKVRKLGNYGGKNKTITGLYSDFAGQITIDTRNDVFFHSVKHEEIHRMDLNNINKIGRNNLISLLDKYFDKKLPNSEMKNYYLIPEELIARAGEVTCMLLAGNYKVHYNLFASGEIDEQTLWEKVKTDFENSKDYVLMKSFDRYLKNDEYIDFKNITNENSIENQLIEVCFEYYKPFFGNEKTDVVKLLQKSPKIGYENRQIEGLDTKKLDTNWVIYFDNKDSLEMLNLVTKRMSITPIEIPDFKNLEKSNIRPLENVLLDFANNNGSLDELQIHINGKGFETNPLENLEDDNLLFSTVKNKEIISMLVKDNQINVTNLLTRIKEIEDNKLANDIYFELLDSVLHSNIDRREINNFRDKYLDILNDIEYSTSTFTKEDEDLMYIRIAKQFGHVENSNTKDLGQGLFNRYCLGDDYSQKAKEFNLFKNSCKILRNIKHYKEGNNELSYLQNLVKYSNDFLSFNNKQIKSLLLSIVNSKQNENKKNELLIKLKENTSGRIDSFEDALIDLMFSDNLNKLTKGNFEALNIDMDKLSKYVEIYKTRNSDTDSYITRIKENPFFYYEKFVNFFDKNDLPFSKIKFIYDLVDNFISFKFDTKDILNLKVQNKIIIEKNDLDFEQVLKNDSYANFSLLLLENLFEYKNMSKVELLETIGASNPNRFSRYMTKGLELALLQDDFNKLNEILTIDVDKIIGKDGFVFKAYGNNFNIDKTIKEQDYKLNNEALEIDESNIVFIDENLDNYEKNRFYTKATDIAKVYLSLKNEDYDNANQRLKRFGDISGGLFVALNDNSQFDYFSKFNELYRDNDTENEIKDFNKITFAENDIISKINKYIEHYFIDSKLNKFDREEKKEFLRQVCTFSNKIDESNIVDSIQSKRVPRKILSKIFDEDFFDNWHPTKIEISEVVAKDKDTNFFTIDKQNFDKVKDKANSILNKLDFLSLNTRKSLANTFNKNIERKVFLKEDVDLNYKTINDKINCLKDYDVDEFISCKTKLYEMYVYDFVVNHKDSPMISKLIALDNKMKFHLNRHYTLGSDGIENNLKKMELHKNILINGTKFIDKIIDSHLNLLSQISPCKDFVALANNINKIIESTGVSNDENNQISNDSNINNSIAI